MPSMYPDFTDRYWEEEVLDKGQLRKSVPVTRGQNDKFDMSLSSFGKNSLGPKELRNLETGLTGGAMLFDDSSTGLAPGESITISPQGVNLQGRNVGINAGATGIIGATYEPDDRSYSVGADVLLPVNGREPSVNATFKVGTERAPYGKGMPGNVTGAVDASLGVKDPESPFTNETPGQRFLKHHLHERYGVVDSFPHFRP